VNKSSKVSSAKRLRVVLRDGLTCWYCGRTLSLDIPGDLPMADEAERAAWAGYATIDHLTPQSRGGTHDLANLVLCCRSCNSRKKTKTLEELRTVLGNQRPEVQAWLHLKWSRELSLTPYDTTLATAEAWLRDQITPFVFAGERKPTHE
jgi:5-methylcytosine-specific restriction endonuclease McrA